MRLSELLENRSRKVIVVDVQPAYSNNDDDEIFERIIKFVDNQNSKVLIFVNAEEQGLTDDTIDDIKYYWEKNGFDDWNRVEIIDKGYGYFRAWMDLGVSESNIIKTIRYMYQKKITDSRDDIDGIKELLGDEWEDWMEYDSLSVEWISVKKLKEYEGSYIVGGGRNECLREITLLMNAFNIKYTLINNLIYGE